MLTKKIPKAKYQKSIYSNVISILYIKDIHIVLLNRIYWLLAKDNSHYMYREIFVQRV
jgi:hypothetical protein